MLDLKLWSLVTIALWYWYKNRENRIRTEDPRINSQQYIYRISKEGKKHILVKRWPSKEPFLGNLDNITQKKLDPYISPCAKFKSMQRGAMASV